MKREVFVLAIAALAYSLSANEQKIGGRIFGGYDALPGVFNFMAVLSIPTDDPGKRKICGGTLIAPHWIMTAAHCVEDEVDFDIYLGTIYIQEAEISYKIRAKDKSVILHPNYDPIKLWNDIALIRIPNTLACDGISFAPLHYLSMYTLVDERAAIIGFGRIGNYGDISTRLQWAEVKVISNDKCNEFYGDIIDSDICVDTQLPYGAPCIGDSGGPLLLNTNEVIGIASAVPLGGCEAGHPSTFTRVSSYVPWIMEVTGIH